MKRTVVVMLVLATMAVCQPVSADEREEAVAAMQAGNYRYARDLFLALVGRAESRFGANAPETIRAYVDVGNACFSMQDANGALDAYGTALRRARGSSAPDLHLVGYLEYRIGAVGMNTGSFAAAQPFLERALQIEAGLGEAADAPILADTCYYLGRCFVASGALAKGIESLEMSRRFYERIRESGSPGWGESQQMNFADVLIALGEAQISAQAYASSREALQLALGIYLGIVGEDDPRTVRACGNLGVSAYYLGDLDEAISMNERALAILLRHRAETDPGNRKFYQNLSAFYELKGDKEKAASYRQKAAEATRP